MHPHDRRCYKKSQRQEIHIRESGSLVRRPLGPCVADR
jgi:hypothetical protein